MSNKVGVKIDEFGQSFIEIRLDISVEICQDLGSLSPLCNFEMLGEQIKQVFLEAISKDEKERKNKREID